MKEIFEYLESVNPSTYLLIFMNFYILALYLIERNINKKHLKNLEDNPQ